MLAKLSDRSMDQFNAEGNGCDECEDLFEDIDSDEDIHDDEESIVWEPICEICYSISSLEQF